MADRRFTMQQRPLPAVPPVAPEPPPRISLGQFPQSQPSWSGPGFSQPPPPPPPSQPPQWNNDAPRMRANTAFVRPQQPPQQQPPLQQQQQQQQPPPPQLAGMQQPLGLRQDPRATAGRAPRPVQVPIVRVPPPGEANDFRGLDPRWVAEQTRLMANQPWFRATASRDDATRELAGKTAGDFVVRLSSQPGHYAVSVNLDVGKTEAILIMPSWDPRRLAAGETLYRLGAQTSLLFDHIPDLVRFYRTTAFFSDATAIYYLGAPPSPSSAAAAARQATAGNTSGNVSGRSSVSSGGSGSSAFPPPPSGPVASITSPRPSQQQQQQQQQQRTQQSRPSVSPTPPRAREVVDDMVYDNMNQDWSQPADDDVVAPRAPTFKFAYTPERFNGTAEGPQTSYMDVNRNVDGDGGESGDEDSGDDEPPVRATAGNNTTTTTTNAGLANMAAPLGQALPPVADDDLRLTVPEKRAYAELWFEATNGRDQLGPQQAVAFFSTSGLSHTDLSRVWTLADTNNRGTLDKTEFAVALKLIALSQAGHPISLRSLALPTAIPRFASGGSGNHSNNGSSSNLAAAPRAPAPAPEAAPGSFMRAPTVNLRRGPPVACDDDDGDA